MINNFNRQRFNQTFRLADSPLMKVQGYFGQPPSDVSYSSNPIRMLVVHYKSIPLKGQQIISTVATKGRFLVGSFVSNAEHYVYRCYEANYVGKLIRAVQQIHPITRLPQKATPIVLEEELWVNVEYAAGDPPDSLNPIKFAKVISTTPIQTMDTVGMFLIRNVVVQNGLYVARAEYGSLTENR